MPSQPDFEYHYRWADGLDAAELDARDQALEAHMASFGGGCAVQFEYTYKWVDILAADTNRQLEMLEANMTALEQAVSATGGCTLEFPFRWVNFWEALKDGEAWAIGIAEENDRAIEFRFGRCACQAFGIRITGDVTLGSPDSALITDVVESGTITRVTASGWPGVCQVVVNLNGSNILILGPGVSPLDTGSSFSNPVSAGDDFFVTAAPFLGGPFPIEVFIEIDGWTADVNATWV